MLKLYSKLADWFHLLTAPSEYAEESACYWELMSKHMRRPIETMLDLGCGGGNNASHLKRRCRMTLTDLSEEMLRVSKRLNPECEHVQGDMRFLRLGRDFDVVFVHDAVMYLRSELDLRRAMLTAWQHCAPGGVALFVPDFTRETWKPSTDHGGHDGDGRSLRYLDWTYDPDPTDTEYVVEMVYLLKRHGRAVRVERERHRFGLFPRRRWLSLMREVGFLASLEAAPLSDGVNNEAFVGRRPVQGRSRGRSMGPR